MDEPGYQVALIRVVIRWDKWADRFANRQEAAQEYARLMELNGTAWTEWGPINEAILRRWSISGLSHIKKKAWKMIYEAKP
jgi:hypothetical protein